MSTPSSVPVVPPGVPSEIAQQQQFQDADRAASAETDEVRALAMQLNKPELAFDPATFKKGIITAASDGPPPTVSLQISGDTQTTVTGVRRMENYSPLVGQTVLLAKQGAEILALGHIATEAESADWVQATLQIGFTHNGDSQGNLFYRKVVDHGANKIQWKGGVGHTGANTLIANLPTGFRPVSKRTLVAARENAAGGGAVAVKVEFQTDGDVVLDGTTARPSVADLSTSTVTYDPPAHSHGGAVASTDFANFVHDHDMTGTLTVEEPEWVSFNGLEYFLD